MSNPRFANKGLVKPMDYASLSALINYFENGGTIKVAKPTKRPKNSITKGKSIKVKD